MTSKAIAIHVKPETWERCKRFGVYGDSQDDLLNRVVDLADKYSPLPKAPEPTQTPPKTQEDSKPLEQTKSEVNNEQQA